MAAMTRRMNRAARAGLGVTVAAAVIAGLSVVALAADGARIGKLFESSFAHEATGKTGKALSDVKAVLAIDSNHYFANLRAGWLAYLAGNYPAALGYYDRATALAPHAVEPKLGRMLPLMAAKRWRDAEVAGKSVLRTDSGNYLARSRMAFIFFSQGRYGDAEKTYRAVLGDYPSDMDMMLGLGWTLLRQGRRTEARRAFSDVLAIRPNNANARAGLAAIK